MKPQQSKIPPIQKIAQLTLEVELLKERVSTLKGETTLDEMLEVIYLEDLCVQFNCSLDCIKSKLNEAGGKVFKLGKKYVIRKVRLLKVMERLESG